MRKVISILISAIIIISNITYTSANTIMNNQELITEDKVVSLNNLQLNNGVGVIDLSSQVSKFQEMEQGTIVVKFYKPNSGLQALFSVSNSKTPNGYANLYVSSNTIGMELRSQVDNVTTNLDHVTATKNLNPGINTVAFKVTKDVGYKIFLNGELIRELEDTTTNFLGNVSGIDKVMVGMTDRSSGNEYKFSGAIDFIDIYDTPIEDNKLIQVTGETSIGKISDYYPEDVYITEPLKLFNGGDLGSNNFRIPSLLTTKEGTVIAGIDVRHGGPHDSPNNIDTGIKRKEKGKDWDEGQIILDFPNSASAIDTALLQDDTTGRIFLLVTQFANGYGYPNAKIGSGYTTIDGKRYRSLYDRSQNLYTIRDDGRVYNSDNIITDYIVDSSMDVYEKGIKRGNALGSSSPLKVHGTSFIIVTHSDDDGKTWSNPVELNKYIKEDWMKFLGTAPGRGIQVKNGEYAGRLVFPVYLTNSFGFQSSATIYSDDHGMTWKMGETANDGRDMGNGVVGNAETMNSGNQLTECQVVEMPNGQLKLFMRNTGVSGGRVKIATSFDGGATWDNTVINETALQEPYCQLSVINYSKPVDGKPALIFSNPMAGSRNNGTVRIGLINENGTHENGQPKYEFEWKYKQTIQPGFYSYSCLTELPNGDIGVFYEPGNRYINYQEMSLEYIKFDINNNVESAKISKVESLDEDMNYVVGEEINLKFTFDSAVSIIGDRTFTIKFGEQEVELEQIGQVNSKEFYFKGVIPEGIVKSPYSIILKGNSNTNVYNLFAHVLNMESDIDIKLNLNIRDLEDVNYDDKIDIIDLSTIATSYNKTSDSSDWNKSRDLNKDNIVDVYDLILVSKKL